MRKTLSTLALAGALALTGGTAAAANEYPAPPVSGSVSDATVQAGETFYFYGSGFEAGETVTIAVSSNQGGGAGGAGAAFVPVKFDAPASYTATADAEGNLTQAITIDKPGRHWITATGESGATATASVVVQGPPAGKGNGKDKDDEAEAEGAGFEVENDAEVQQGSGFANKGNQFNFTADTIVWNVVNAIW